MSMIEEMLRAESMDRMFIDDYEKFADKVHEFLIEEEGFKMTNHNCYEKIVYREGVGILVTTNATSIRYMLYNPYNPNINPSNNEVITIRTNGSPQEEDPTRFKEYYVRILDRIKNTWKNEVSEKRKKKIKI
jgi:hypothetical protein